MSLTIVDRQSALGKWGGAIDFANDNKYDAKGKTVRSLIQDAVYNRRPVTCAARGTTRSTIAFGRFRPRQRSHVLRHQGDVACQPDAVRRAAIGAGVNSERAKAAAC
jgi:hypothetical protein